jgi:hypothetical protein
VAIRLVLDLGDAKTAESLAEMYGDTDSGNQSCPEASIPDLAVRIIRLFEQLGLGFSEPNLTLVFHF